MFGLIPKEEKFFQMFQEMGGLIVDGARLLKEMLDDYSDPVASQKAIKDVEHLGDQKTHEIIKKLNSSFITPFIRPFQKRPASSFRVYQLPVDLYTIAFMRLQYTR